VAAERVEGYAISTIRWTSRRRHGPNNLSAFILTLEIAFLKRTRL
jgi:hypothetical protein